MKLTAAEREALERFARGATVGDIAYATGKNLSVIQRMLTDLCDLDRARAARIIDGRDTPAGPPAAAEFVEPAATHPPPEEDPLSTWEGVLQVAEAHPSVLVQRLAVRARNLLEDLLERLEAEVAERAEAERVEAARAEALAKVARLEAELAQAREEATAAGVPGRKAPRRTPDHDPRQVRAWAREHSIACPGRGVIPKAVMAAYIEEHPMTR